MIYMCCVGFASLDIVYNELNGVPGMLVCSSFLIGVCMFIVIIHAGGGGIWLNPFATVLFTGYSAVTVKCCVMYPCCVGVFVVI